MTSQLAFALQARDEGIARSADHAESVDPGWGESCYRVLRDFIGENREFNSYEFREFLGRIGFPCPVPKALGAVMQRAAREGLIRKIGYDPHPERHCSPTPRWIRA